MPNTSSIEGLITRVNPSNTHRKFAHEYDIETVLLRFNHVRRLVEKGYSADSWFGESATVITSTVDDDSVHGVTWEQERDLISQFEPDYHIPTDYTVYQNQVPEARTEQIRSCMRGTEWMHNELEKQDVQTDILPVLKGTNLRDREICHDTFDEIGTESFVVNGLKDFPESPYTQSELLADHLRDIRVESDRNVVLLAVLTPEIVLSMPQNVTATAGLTTWRKRVKPQERSLESSRSVFNSFRESVESALITPPGVEQY